MAGGSASMPWGNVSSKAQDQNKGFFNLDAEEASPSKSRSFKDVLTCSSGDTLPSLTPSTFNGVPAVLISDDDVLKLASPFRFTLVGKFGVRCPNLDAIRSFFGNLKLSGFYSVGLLDSKHVAIQLSNDLDYSRIFARRSYFIFNCHMRILKWTPFFDVKEESPIVPIWVSFLNLRLHFFNPKVLHALAHGHAVSECFKLHPELKVKSNTSIGVAGIKETTIEDPVIENPETENTLTNVAGNSNVERVGSETLKVPESVDTPTTSPVKTLTVKDKSFVENGEISNIFIYVDSMLNNSTPPLTLVNTENIDDDPSEDQEKGEYVPGQTLPDSMKKGNHNKNGEGQSSATFSDKGKYTEEEWISKSGIGGSDSKNRVRNLCRVHNISFLVLLEPFISFDKLTSTAASLGFSGSFSNCSNKIWIMWKNHFNVAVISDFQQVVNVQISFNQFNFYTSSVYASSTINGRIPLWECLTDFAHLIDGPWCVGGDFNIISNVSERTGGNPPNMNAMDDFNQVISSCNLTDIGFSGSSFTWNRNNMWQRLDRLLFNNDWISKFNMTRVQHLSRTLSDHSPLLLFISNSFLTGPVAFRFQNMWIKHVGFFNVVSENWNALVFPDNNIHGMHRLWAKLSRLKQLLRWWNKHVFKNIFENIKEAEEKVLIADNLFLEIPSSENMANLDNSKLLLFNLQNQEEIFWKQKASNSILLEGDRNTSFLHALVNKNRIKSYIHKLTDEHGVVYDNVDTIVNSGVDYFYNIFNVVKPVSSIINTNVIPNILDENDNSFLTQLPNEEEIWNTIKGMNVESVADPDDYTTKFFVKTWDIIKADMVDVVHDFFKGKPYPKAFSCTNIVLIPKKDNITFWKDFIPISLYGVC
ncbi:uncharacterized protein LOC110094257 [Dendrobium catenatum]|uniref:uncharacterized protein LOC110094257 n=1 Tax=Dendrobium catenatum TaxID=906689 RepID=UPI00109EEE45|nr:uncharacterized protein LOC110094257 [Dendrobium catenatum]